MAQLTEQGAAFEVVGRGPATVLFVHGLGSSRRCFDEAPPFFDEARHTLVFVDLPGFGEGAAPERGAFTMAELADALEAVLLTHLGRTSAHLVAHSMGGAVALLLADSALVEVRSFASAEGNLVAADAFMSSKVSRLKEPVFVKVWSKWLGFVEESLGQGRQHRLFLETIRQTAPHVIYRASRSCWELTGSGELGRRFVELECPKLFLVGEKTRAERGLPPPVVEAGAEVLTLPGADHFVMEQAEAFYPPIRALIDDVEARRR